MIESENPIVAFAAPSGIDGNNRDNRIVLVTSVSVDEGEAVVIVEMDAGAIYQKKNISANKTITIYGRDTIVNDISQAITDGRVLHHDKKRAHTVYPVRKGSNSLTAIGKQELTNNISIFG